MLRFVPRFAAVLVLIVAGTLAPAAAKERPFKASGEGYVSYFHTLLFAGGIKATHLGPSRLSAQLGLDDLEYGLFYPVGFGVLTSASGDELRFFFDEEYYYVDPATGVVSGTVTFTGGTGRFQDATGSADVTFDFNPTFESFTFLIDGSIDY